MFHEANMNFSTSEVVTNKQGDSNSRTSNHISQFDIRIYVILALVPILLTLVRVWCAFYGKRQKQRQRNQQITNTGSIDEGIDDSSSLSSGLTKPPPSYQDLFGNNGDLENPSSIFSISREQNFCSSCERAQCNVVLVAGKTRIPKSTEENRQNSIDETHPDSLEEGKEITTEEFNVTGEFKASVSCKEPRASVLNIETLRGRSAESSNANTEINLCITSSCHDFAAENSFFNVFTTSSYHDFAAEKGSLKVADTMHIEDELSGDTCTESRTLEESNSSTELHRKYETVRKLSCDFADVKSPVKVIDTIHFEEELLGHISAESRTLAEPKSSENSNAREKQFQKSNLNGFLNAALLRLPTVSQPCTCSCHWAIPSQHHGVAGSDNSSSAREIDDCAVNKHPSYPAHHISLFDYQRIWLDLPGSSSATKAQLPCYEDALELVKLQNAESEKTHL